MSCIRGRHVGGVISWGRHDLFPEDPQQTLEIGDLQQTLEICTLYKDSANFETFKR